jgi:hypothetical protein
MTKFLLLIPILTLALISCNSQTTKQAEKDTSGSFKSVIKLKNFGSGF